MSQGFTQVFPYYCIHMIAVRVSNDIRVDIQCHLSGVTYLGLH